MLLLSLLQRTTLLRWTESGQAGAAIDDTCEVGLKLRVGETGKLAQASQGERVAGQEVLQSQGRSHVEGARSAEAGLRGWLLCVLLQAREAVEELEGAADAWAGRVGCWRRPDSGIEVGRAREEGLLLLLLGVR